ncbi:MAG: substrate-binding domain-containing protein [Lachnospiraceae bacterium]|nr:substrate-binding domain-containing protein [Lachnospiraceae bacterium]
MQDPQEKKGEVRYTQYLLVILIGLLLAIGVVSVYIHVALHQVEANEPRYTYHFAYISKAADAYTTNRIYEEARAYGLEKAAYIEKFRSNSINDYTDADYVRMATAMEVDGIIVEGSGDEQLLQAINEASIANIPVITILSDSKKSCRDSFIEIGSYNLGREYARTLIQLSRGRYLSATILLDEEDTSNIELMRGMRETLANEGNHLSVELQVLNVHDLANFRITDMVREILEKEPFPEFLICVTEKDTMLTYKAMKDYNLTGRTHLVGLGISESFLKAIQDGEMAAVIDVDAVQMGTLCVETLVQLNEEGTVNSHLIADDTVITKENVARYLNDEE